MFFSDHCTVTSEIKCKHNPVESKYNIIYRYTHNIDILAFNDDKVKYELITNPKADLSRLCEQYYTTHNNLLDKHPPVRYKSIKIKPPAPWCVAHIYNTYGGNHAHNLTSLDILNSAISAIES